MFSAFFGKELLGQESWPWREGTGNCLSGAALPSKIKQYRLIALGKRGNGSDARGKRAMMARKRIFYSSVLCYVSAWRTEAKLRASKTKGFATEYGCDKCSSFVRMR